MPVEKWGHNVTAQTDYLLVCVFFGEIKRLLINHFIELRAGNKGLKNSIFTGSFPVRFRRIIQGISIMV